MWALTRWGWQWRERGDWSWQTAGGETPPRPWEEQPRGWWETTGGETPPQPGWWETAGGETPTQPRPHERKRCPWQLGGWAAQQGGWWRNPLPQTHVLRAWLPYLGSDFGMQAWLDLQRRAKENGAKIKLRGREQEAFVAARQAPAQARRRAEERDVLLRRLTITSEHGSDSVRAWYAEAHLLHCAHLSPSAPRLPRHLPLPPSRTSPPIVNLPPSTPLLHPSSRPLFRTIIRPPILMKGRGVSGASGPGLGLAGRAGGWWGCSRR